MILLKGSYKNMEILSLLNVGKILNMKEFAKAKSNVSLVETFVSMKCIGGELSEDHSRPMST